MAKVQKKKRGRHKGPKAPDADLPLIKKIRQGDQRAFEEIVEKYQSRCYRLAKNLTKNDSDAEEVLQEVFYTVFKKIDQFREKSAFSSWLYRITVNASFMKLRSKKSDRTVSIEDIPTLETGRSTPVLDWSSRPDEELYSTEVRELLTKAINKLPEEYRSVLVFRDVEGLTNDEVAEALNLTIPAVKSRLHRARLFLRKSLADYYEK